MKICKTCGRGTANYDQQYDAYYCRVCDLWLEVACQDTRCSFCPGRPERPSDSVTKRKEDTDAAEDQ